MNGIIGWGKSKEEGKGINRGNRLRETIIGFVWESFKLCRQGFSTGKGDISTIQNTTDQNG